MRNWVSLMALGFLFLLVAVPGYTQTYYSENFDTLTTATLAGAGWDIGKNEFATEQDSDFFIAPEWLNRAPGSGTGFFNPPMMDGNESSGGYLMSDSDAADGSDNIFSQSEFWAITPVFSTVGSTEAWFHADVDLESNNNGECVAEFAVTIDDGKTWLPIFQMVEPQRVQKGVPDSVGADRTKGYPVLGSGSQTKTFDGIHGRKHFKLPAEANNQAKVRVRFEWYEPADAWWMAIDNLVIDNNPAPVGKTVVLTENFDSGIPAAWKNASGAAGKTHVWGTTPLKAEDGSWLKLTAAWGPTNVDILQMAKELGMTIDLNDPDPQLNPNGSVLDGHWMLMLAGQKYAMYQEGADEEESANLDTPSLDLTGTTAVYLDFDSEMLRGNNVSVFYDVYASVDGGQNFNMIFNYEGAISDDGGETPYFDHQYLVVPSAAGKSNVIFRFGAKGGDPGSDPANPRMQGFWVIDNVRVSADKATAIPNWMLF